MRRQNTERRKKHKYYPFLKRGMAEEGALPYGAITDTRQTWDEATIKFAAEMEDVWQNISHSLAGDKKIVTEDEDVMWVANLPPLINERGREELHVIWSSLINKVIAFSALTEQDVDQEILQVKLDIIFLIGLEKTNEYEISEGSLDTIFDAICEPIFHILRAAQGGGLREMFSIIRKETVAPQPQPQQQGGLFSLIPGPWRRR